MLFFNASPISAVLARQSTEEIERPRRATDSSFGKTTLLNNMQFFCTQWLSKPRAGGGRRRLLLLGVIIVKLFTRTNQLIDRRMTMKATEFGEIIRNNGNYVAQDHSWSPILVPIESSYYGLSIGPICDFLLVINTNLPPILHHFQVMAGYTRTPERDGRTDRQNPLAITAVCIAHCGPAVKTL